MRGSCLCAASPPPPQPAASPARLSPRAEQRGACEPAGTSQAGRAIPAEPVQELEFVIRLCNAVGAKCDHSGLFKCFAGEGFALKHVSFRGLNIHRVFRVFGHGTRLFK